ncbi:hypothetical protein INN71_03975 [Nocardioides sp. ChNu-153]|uniref:hypothetical protein n=1 Tax=unclassified Nocardioides TaxID=2615069 RepID=UPI00240630CA|nr:MULTISPECIES: hypothetical protein [unclassified Nocardioides]MDF9716614.1 hypothetical protein [Nocardioides sp. ChNu-99]MDN7120547.1 hypothetical protein [Nocardioides sp. ChNu-153]
MDVREDERRGGVAAGVAAGATAGVGGTDVAPRRAVLRPGWVPVRRGDGHLQVGVDGPERALLPATDAVREHLVALHTAGAGPTPDAPSARDAHRRLAEAGLLVDADALLAALGTAGDGTRRSAVSALWADHPADAADRLHGRRDARVRVTGAEPWRSAIEDALEEALVRPAGDGAGAGTGAGTTTRAPVCTVHVAVGELDRAVVDELVRRDEPHLVVVLRAGGARLGPFVVAGTTACQRCVDAGRSEEDPRYPLVVSQAAASAPGLVPPPVDPGLARWAVGWAVSDVLRFVDGGLPTTWSATVDLDGAMPARTPWARHPWCGCSWDEVEERDEADEQHEVEERHEPAGTFPTGS